MYVRSRAEIGTACACLRVRRIADFVYFPQHEKEPLRGVHTIEITLHDLSHPRQIRRGRLVFLEVVFVILLLAYQVVRAAHSAV
jgi:hypothetical protein